MFRSVRANFDSKIAEQFNLILQSADTFDSDSISIYEVGMLLRDNRNHNSKYTDKIERLIEKKSNDKNLRVSILGMKHNTLHVQFTTDMGYGIFGANAPLISHGYYKKQLNSLYLSREKGGHYNPPRVLCYAGNELSEVYDYYLKFQQTKKQPIAIIKSINAPVEIKISCENVEISTLTNWLKFKFHVLGCNEFHSPSQLMSQIPKKELCKKIFIRIDDCPAWMQNELRKRRKEQLFQTAVYIIKDCPKGMERKLKAK